MTHLNQENRTRSIKHRATSPIAASALSLTLTPSIALAEGASDAQAQQPAQTFEANESGSVSKNQSIDQTDASEAPEEGIAADANQAQDPEPSTSEQRLSDEPTPLSMPVARIAGGAEFATFDEAVAAAPDGSTIELLADVTTTGLNLSKNLTIDGRSAKHSLAFADKGIALWGKSLTLKNMNVTMNGVGSTPYTAEWNWSSICAGANSSITLDNASLSLDGSGTAGNTHAIYLRQNDKLNLQNASTLSIKNYAQDALEWDGGNGGYNLNITSGSTYLSDHNRSGIVGTFYATIDASTVKVINSTGNGSNGTYYAIKNGSKVAFDNNGAWGMSAWRIDMTGNSSLSAVNNAYSGVWTRVLNLDSNYALTVEKNGTKGTADQNAGITFFGNGTYKSEIAQGAQVAIKNNAGCGIATKQTACNLTIGSATITNNGTGAVNANGTGAQKGGGIYNMGTLALGPSVEIYNNHASIAGDDLYSEAGKAVTQFDKTGTGWFLDDCEEAIDSWYHDPQENRWNAHPEAEESAYVITKAEGKIEGELALKAAHGLAVEYQYVGEFPAEAQKPETETGLQKLPYYAAIQGTVPGWTFDGWYTDEACTAKWVDYTPLAGNMTLYGKWTKTAENEPSAVEPGQPGSQTTLANDKKSQQATNTEQLAKTSDAALPFGFAAIGIAFIAAAAASISRKLLKR